MMINKRNKKAIAPFLFTVAAVVALIFWGKECSQGAKSGISLCLNVLIPSIFPFMVISVFAAESGLSEKLGKITGGLCKALFGVSGNLSAVIIMSMIGGYPVGARGIAALRKNGVISEKDAETAAYFAVGAGPGFLFTFVGSSLLSSPEIGACLMVAQVASVIILGFVNKIIFVRKTNYNSKKELYSNITPFSSALTKSVISASYGMFEMCGMVVVFSALMGITEKLLGDMNVYAAILFEVTAACGILSKQVDIRLIAFAVGFGGLCVHFQIFTALKDIKINKYLFFLFRIIQGGITALITSLLIKIFRISLPVFSSVGTLPELSLSTSLIGSVMLLLCAVGFIYSIKRI